MVDDDRIGVGDPGSGSQKIEIMARALVDLFGDRAPEVSQRQADTGESATESAIWRKIVAQIGRLRA